MSLCIVCAQPMLGDTEVCVFHLYGQGDDWAVGNRVMCDFLHRGIVRRAPPKRDGVLEPAVFRP